MRNITQFFQFFKETDNKDQSFVLLKSFLFGLLIVFLLITFYFLEHTGLISKSQYILSIILVFCIIGYKYRELIIQALFNNNFHHIYNELSSLIISIDSHGRILDKNRFFIKKFNLEEGFVIDYHKKIVTLQNKYGKNFAFLLVELSRTYKTRVFLLQNVEKIPDLYSNRINTKFLDFISASPIPKIAISKNGEILKVNDLFLNLIGKNYYDNKYTIFDIIDPEDHQKAKSFIKTILMSQKDIPDQKPLEIKLSCNNNTIIVLLYANRTLDENYLENVIIAHLIDITEQKKLEMNFIHSQKMQAIGQLAGGIAHDFNNLLTAMLGFCDLLLNKHPPGDPSFAEIMQIKQNGNRAANLVRQLLAFSKKQVLHPQIHDANEIIAELSNLIHRLIGEKIELKTEYERELNFVKVDQGQLEQVIINLAVNARDAMGEGGTLTIRTRNITVDEIDAYIKNLNSPIQDEKIEKLDYAVIEVEDTGTGISKENLTRIFEPFFTTKKLHEGTGLGLATVYGIVKQTGGYVYLTSKKNKGTRFSILLRNANEEHEKQAKELALIKTEEKIEEKPVADFTGRGKILLVEDEDSVRAFSIMALKNKGYEVYEAASAEDALTLLDNLGGKVEVVVTDVIMPGMNGPDMIVKMLDKYPNINVVFMSGYTEDAFKTEALKDYKFDFLAKPFSLKQLVSKVKDAMEKL